MNIQTTLQGALDTLANLYRRVTMRVVAGVTRNPLVCNRCGTRASFQGVSPGYFAVCPMHDEDLYSIEVCSLSDYQEN